MSSVSQLALLFVGAALINNILLTRFIGLCPFFGVSSNMETSIGMSLSVIFVMVMSSTATWVVWEFVLAPLGVGEFLYIPAFILIIASLVQFVEMATSGSVLSGKPRRSGSTPWRSSLQNCSTLSTTSSGHGSPTMRPFARALTA